MEFPSQDVSKTYSIIFLAKFQTDFEPVQGSCTMNVRNAPLHNMACVEKCEIPPNRGGNFVSFNMEKEFQLWEYI